MKNKSFKKKIQKMKEINGINASKIIKFRNKFNNNKILQKNIIPKI
jgi:hypothetical protein